MWRDLAPLRGEVGGINDTMLGAMAQVRTRAVRKECGGGRRVLVCVQGR